MPARRSPSGQDRGPKITGLLPVLRHVSLSGLTGIVLQIQFPAGGQLLVRHLSIGAVCRVFYWGSAQENEDREFKVKLGH